MCLDLNRKWRWKWWFHWNRQKHCNGCSIET